MPHPLLFVTFGLPGAGKTYVARCFQPFGFVFHDGDDDLPDAMRAAISASLPINDTMRDEFFARIIASVKALNSYQPRLVVSQTFIKEKYRLLFLEYFPHARFVLVQADEAIRERRLTQRSHQPLAPEYARRMSLNFEPPHIPHAIITNNDDGEAAIRQQIAILIAEKQQKEYLTIRVQWEETGNALFPFQATVDGQTWVIRINDFPAEPFYTLFVDGAAIHDFDNWPFSTWQKPSLLPE